MENLLFLREKLRRAQLSCSICIGTSAVLGYLGYANDVMPRPVAALLGAACFGEAAYRGLQAHSVGQELAASLVTEGSPSQ